MEGRSRRSWQAKVQEYDGAEHDFPFGCNTRARSKQTRANTSVSLTGDRSTKSAKAEEKKRKGPCRFCYKRSDVAAAEWERETVCGVQACLVTEPIRAKGESNTAW